jgi:uncharacterized protein YdaU (DUF1376 family)
MLWTDKYLADTRHLTTLEHGAYLLLIMEAWRRPHCDLPDDDRILARMAGLPADEWAEVRDIVMGFWDLDKRRKTWRQKKLTSERDYVTKKRKSQQDKAAKRWKDKEIADATAIPRQSRGNAPTPTPTPTQIIEEPIGSSAPASKRACQLPSNFEPVLTEIAQQHADRLGPSRLANELQRFRDYHAARGSTMKDWQAAFRTWLSNAVDRMGARPNEPHRPAARDNRDGFTQAIDRRLGLGADGSPAAATG